MKCETCNYWIKKVPPSIGTCKITDKVTTHKDICDRWSNGKNYINEMFDRIFNAK